MKKKIIIPICIILALVVLAVAGIIYMNARSLAFSVGRILYANDSAMLVIDHSPIEMSSKKISFDKFTDGDKVLVLHDGIETTYPAKTGVYGIIKLSNGTVDNIPGEVLTELETLGWMTDEYIELPEVMPEDFSFALTWDCYGVSSYDSKTGKLVKTTDATHPEDYITSHALNEEEAERIYNFIRALNINDYPRIYNPHGGLASEPPATLILTVRVGDKAKVIKAEDISASYETGNKKGQSFLTTCKEIRDILTSTEEWKALPDYEFYYD